MLRRQPRKKQLSKLLSLESTTRQHNDLSQLITYAERIQNLDQMLQGELPEQLRGHVQANTLKQGVLTCTCHSATLSTRLKLHQKQIIEAINQKYRLSIQQLKVKIRPRIQSKMVKIERSTLSESNAELLQAEAEQTLDEKLKKALLKLAQNRESRSSHNQ